MVLENTLESDCSPAQPMSHDYYRRFEAFVAALKSPGLSTLVFEDETGLIAKAKILADAALAYAENK